MAEIYVATTGNDTTGTGLIGAPYLTIYKALTVAASGDVIRVGPGTYAEDTGSGYLAINRTFSSYVHIVPDNGDNTSVIITGTTGDRVMSMQGCGLIRFYGLRIRSHSSSVIRVIQFERSALSNIEFDDCQIEILGQSGTVNIGVRDAWNSGDTITQSTVHFINCRWRQLGPHAVAGVSLNNPATGMTCSNWRFINPDIRTGSYAMRLIGLTDFLVQNPNLASTDPRFADTCFAAGQDGATGINTTGVIMGGSISAMIGHAVILGGGCSDVHMIGTVISGGYNASNGQGLVIKNATGGRVAGCTIHSGYLSGLYLKAAQNMLIEDNTVFNRFAAGWALRGEQNPENSSKVTGNVVRNNMFIVNVGKAISWDGASGDDGGNVVDQNVYAVYGSGTWGTVRGTTIASLAALQAAWSGYDRPFNDISSRSGRKAMRDRSALKAAL